MSTRCIREIAQDAHGLVGVRTPRPNHLQRNHHRRNNLRLNHLAPVYYLHISYLHNYKLQLEYVSRLYEFQLETLHDKPVLGRPCIRYTQRDVHDVGILPGLRTPIIINVVVVAHQPTKST